MKTENVNTPAAPAQEVGAVDPTVPAPQQAGESVPAEISPEAPAQSHAEKLSIIQRLRASMSNKESLTAQVGTATASLAEVTAERNSLAEQVATLTAQNADLTKGLNELEASIPAQVKSGTTAKAHQILASAGQSMETLPPAEELKEEETMESLAEQAGKASDPAEKHRLAQKAVALARGETK